jgi:multiple antibiotic resistance protein
MNTGVLQFLVKYFTKLFIGMGPLAIVALFVSMTAMHTPTERIQTVKTSSRVACGTMLFFALAGQKIFEFLGITIGSFYVAGGVIIFLVGLSMLRAEDSDENVTQEGSEDVTPKQRVDISITPLAIPIICGPSCVTWIIALQSEAQGVAQHIAGFVAITLVCSAMYALLMAGAHGAKWLTPIVLKLSYRLSGLILAALAVQMMISGLRHEDLKILRPTPSNFPETPEQCSLYF